MAVLPVEKLAVLNLDLLLESLEDAPHLLSRIKGHLFQCVMVSARPVSQHREIAVQLWEHGVYLSNPDTPDHPKNEQGLPYLIMNNSDPVAALAPWLAFGTIKHVLFAGYSTSTLAGAEGQGYTVQAVATLELAVKAAKAQASQELRAFQERTERNLERRRQEGH